MSELYNLSTDPKQENNIISKEFDKAKDIHEYLIKFMGETNVPSGLMKPRMELSP